MRQEGQGPTWEDSTESDRLQALRMALELHKQGQGVARTADAVILTANAFLKFVRDPVAGDLEAKMVRHVRRAIELMYRAGNQREYVDATLRNELKSQAKLLNDLLHLPVDEETP